MENKQLLAGSWTGELVDIHGFKGELELALAADREGAIKGDYRVAIAAEHDTLIGRGEVAGTTARGKLKLTISMREPAVNMGLEADLVRLRDGGLGLRGTYQVSARGFSTLQGGVVVLSKDRRRETEVISRADRREGVR
jgi:hypothetical protein